VVSTANRSPLNTLKKKPFWPLGGFAPLSAPSEPATKTGRKDPDWACGNTTKSPAASNSGQGGDGFPSMAVSALSKCIQAVYLLCCSKRLLLASTAPRLRDHLQDRVVPLPPHP